jgi:hypothetical protein
MSQYHKDIQKKDAKKRLIRRYSGLILIGVALAIFVEAVI